MEIGKGNNVYIKSMNRKLTIGKIGNNQYLFPGIAGIIFWDDSDIIEISCKTCKFKPSDPCICDSEFTGWIYGGDKMENEMPELKPGMVAKYKNMLGEEEKILICESSEGIFGIIDGKRYASWIDREQILSLHKIKSAKSLEYVRDNDNLETIWERKPATDWTKVAVDTKVLAKIYLRDDEYYWKKYHFAGYWNNKAVVFSEGHTSFTAGHCNGDYADFDDGDIVLYEGNEHLVGDKHEKA